MSLERLKKYIQRLALTSKVLYIITLIILLCETISFLWLSLMPNKLTSFFNVFRIWAPFVTNLDNTALSRYELATGIVQHVFLFLIFLTLRETFLKLEPNLNFSDIARQLKKLSLIFIAESLILPVFKTVSCNVYLGNAVPLETVDMCPVIIGALLYFFSIFALSKSVEIKED